MKVGNLTRWKSVNCSSCGAEAGVNCTSGTGRNKHLVTTYVHSARRVKYSMGLTSAEAKHAPIPLQAPSVAEPSFNGVFLTASELLKNPEITKVSLTTRDGRTIHAEQTGSDTYIKIVS